MVLWNDSRGLSCTSAEPASAAKNYISVYQIAATMMKQAMVEIIPLICFIILTYRDMSRSPKTPS